MTGWAGEVLGFWFGLDKERHWRRDDAVDAQISARFRALWESLRVVPAEAGTSGGEGAPLLAGDHLSRGPGLGRDDVGLERFLVSPEDALAAVILFDQFPRNMFRGSGRAFETDPIALRIAKAAVARGFDRWLPPERRIFLYMPFEHSEDIADQDRSVALFDAFGDAYYNDFARKHRNVIARFGRFPHRNEMLGRESTPEEERFGLEPAW